MRDDIDKEDDQESYFRWLEENPTAGLPMADDDDEDRELQYDDDGNLIAPEISKVKLREQNNNRILFILAY